MKKYKYEEMLPSEFLKDVEDLPVFIIPTGLLEWHGEHLPLGLDTLKVYEICLKIAERLNGGIVLPPQYFGRPGFSNFVGTLTYSESLIYQLFYEQFSQLQKVGAKVVLLISGHYGDCQVNAIKHVAEVWNRENKGMKVIAKAEYENAFVDGAMPCDHAGMWETSMGLYLIPNLVDMQNFKKIPNNPAIYNEPPNHYYPKENGNWTWVNDVENSCYSLGKKAVDAIVEVCFNEIKNELSIL